MTHIFTLL